MLILENGTGNQAGVKSGKRAGLGLKERSHIKHTIKLKTSPARLAQLLQPSLAFCFSLQSMTAYRPGLDCAPLCVIGCKLKQNANDGCNSCASLAGLVLCFIA